MFFQEVSRVIGRYLLYFALILCLPLAVALFYDFFLHSQNQSSLAFFETILVCLGLASLFLYLGKRATGTLHRRESIMLTVLIWFITAFIGALPFWFTRTLENPIDAYFEAMSGLTTTGSTVMHPKAYDPATHQEIPITLQNLSSPEHSYTFYGTVAPLIDPETHRIVATGVEAVAKPLLFWRSLLQWLGGMGIIVLFIAVLPALSMGGRFLFETEVPGPTKEAITPRIKETASVLWKIYGGLTVAQIALLMITNAKMPFFDAVTLSFSTISTGGFSVRNESIQAYQNFHTEQIVMLFMILGSLNFTLYFHCLKGKIYRIYQPEFFLFLLTLVIGSLLMTWNLSSQGDFSFLQALRSGSFQAISAQTSTGFVIGNYGLWPFAAQFLLILLLFLGGMSGSTSGGFKTARVYIMFRALIVKIESFFRPHSVRALSIGERAVSEKTIVNVLIFFCLLVLIATAGTYFLILDGLDMETAFGVVASMVNNGGLTFGTAGPTESCAFLSNFSKIISVIWMVLGRLEFFALLVFFVPAFWKGT